jgi:hypothetical protein
VATIAIAQTARLALGRGRENDRRRAGRCPQFGGEIVLATIHWVRVLIAGVLSEVGVIGVLLLSIAIYKRLGARPVSEAETASLGERIGYYVAPTAGFVTTGLAALWAVRGLDTGIVANAVAVGIVSVAISVPFLFSARREHRLMYVVAFALRLAAAYLAGLFAAA